MAQYLSAAAVTAAILALGATAYAAHLHQRLEVTRSAIARDAARIASANSQLAGVTAAIEERARILRAIAAVPESPVTGARLQEQIDRLQELRRAAQAVVADDPAAAARRAGAETLAAAEAARAALRFDTAMEAYAAGLEVVGQIEQANYALSLRAAVAASEGLAVASRFDPTAILLDPVHFTVAGYDAAAVADAITFSFLSVAEKTGLRTALAAAEGPEALAAALAEVAKALDITPLG